MFYTTRKKSALLFIHCKENRNFVIPKFYSDDNVLPVSLESKILKHFIPNDLLDDKYILRQCHNLYGQGNMFICKFNMYTVDVNMYTVEVNMYNVDVNIIM